MTDEQGALIAVRDHLAQAGHAPMDMTRSTVMRDTVAGRDAWVVNAQTALSPDEPDWMQVQWAPVPHFVDVATGQVFGFAVGSARTFFDAADRTRDEQSRSGH